MKRLRFKLIKELERLMVLFFDRFEEFAYSREKPEITAKNFCYRLELKFSYDGCEVRSINIISLPNPGGLRTYTGYLVIGKRIPKYPIKFIQDVIEDFKNLLEE